MKLNIPGMVPKQYLRNGLKPPKKKNQNYFVFFIPQDPGVSIRWNHVKVAGQQVSDFKYSKAKLKNKSVGIIEKAFSSG